MAGTSRGRFGAAGLALLVVATVVPAVPAGAGSVRAFVPPRFSVNTTGDVLLAGNSSLTCPGEAKSGCPAAEDRSGSSKLNDNDWEMKYVDVDAAAKTFNSSRATLNLPPGSTVLFAGLYWGADTRKPDKGGHKANDAGRRNTVRLARPGTSGYSDVTASRLDALDDTGGPYQAFADVTSTVAGAGTGEYTVADIQAARGVDRYAGWALVVVVEDPAAPSRNLVVYDGFGVAEPSDRQLDLALSGFLAPPAGTVRTRLGIVAYDGDTAFTSDSLRVLSGVSEVAVSDRQSPADNVFNSTISDLGAAVTTRNPAHANTLGFDIDRFDGRGLLPNGATSATLRLRTDDQDRVYPGVVTFATELFSPALTATKTVTDRNGGAAEPGDELVYEVSVANTGQDAANGVVLTDAVPTHTSYVPGSLSTDGAARSDAAGDDPGEVADTGRVTARLGTGATGSAGGILPVNGTATVRFSVRINRDAPHETSLPNRAGISYRGAQNGLVLSGASNTVTTVVVRPRADLRVERAGRPATVTVDPDGTATYRVTLTNDGPLADPGVRVTDRLPTGFTATAAETTAGTCTGVGTATVTCDVGAVSVGQIVTVTVTAAVGAGAADPSTGTATVSGTLEDLDPADNSAGSSTAVNRPPVAADDTARTATGTAVAVAVAANDTDPDPGATLTVSAVTQGANGTVAATTGGLAYTPSARFTGTDTFAYTVSDGRGGTDTATVIVTVDNAAPVAVDDDTSTTVDKAVTVAVAANDTDANGDGLTVTAVTGPGNGSVTFDAAAGTVTYTPANGYAGTDTFTYTVEDGRGGSDTATVTVTVPNAAPAAAADRATTGYATAVDIGVLANDNDPNGDPLSTNSVSAPVDGGGTTRGTVEPGPGGTLRYVPPAGFSGTVTFTYRVSDPGGATSEPATVTVTVGNGTPVTAGDSAAAAFGTPVGIAVLVNDTDPDGDPLTVSALGAPTAGGAVTANPDGTVTYTPPAGFSGIATFTYTVSDGDGGTADATVTVTVANALPAATPDARTTDPDTAVEIAVLANDTDANPEDQDALAVKDGSVTAPVDAAGNPAGAAAAGPAGTVTYTPPPGFLGTATFAYTVVDTRGGEATGTVTVMVVNRLPVAEPDGAVTPPATAVTVDVIKNDSDPNGDRLTVTGTTAAGHGTVTTDGATVVYTPAAAWVGIDTFSYTVSDGRGGAAAATVTVTTLDAFPTAAPDAATTGRDTAIDIRVLANDSDPNNDVLALYSVDPGSVRGGRATIDGRGTADPADDVVRYTPPAGFTGVDTFTYGIDDARGGTARGTVTVTVPDNGPTALADAAAIPTDGIVEIAVLGNDSDPDGDPLTVTVTTAPTHGDVVVLAGGVARYQPRHGFAGTDRFGYTASDGRGGSATAEVTVTVANAEPVAVADRAGTGPGVPVAVPVRANDSDPNGDLLTIAAFDGTTPGGGRVALDDRGTPDDADDALAYTPVAAFKGDDTFGYRISDGRGGTATATVTVTVGDADPVAAGDIAATAHATPIGIDVLANDTDPNPGDRLAVVAGSVTGPVSGSSPAGTAVLGDGGRVTYTPPAGFRGVATFTYRVTDDNPGTAQPEGTVTVTVANAPVVAVDDTATTGRGASLSIAVLANDTDANGDGLTVVGIAPGAGTAVLEGGGTVGYTPPAGFTGTDTFTYTVSDGDGGNDAATVTVTVPNGAPVAVDDAATVLTDEARAVVVLINDTDPDGDPLTVTRILSGPASGTAVIGAGGAIVYTPVPGYLGTVQITYEVADDRGGVGRATVTITVPNTPPVALPDDDATGPGDPVTITVLDNDTDANPGQTLVLGAIVTAPAGGTATANGDGTVTYTPAAGFKGTDTFAYEVADGAGGTAVGTVTLTVSDAVPVAVDDHYRTAPGTPVRMAVLDNDFDPNPDDRLVIVADRITVPLDEQARPTGTVVLDDPTPGGTRQGLAGSGPGATHQALAAPALVFTPPAGFAGEVTFGYAVGSAGGGPSDAATVTVAIDNAPPVAAADRAALTGSAPLAVAVLANDTDPNGDRLRIVGLSTPTAGGAVAVDDNGTPADPSDDRVRYTPPAGFGGIDTFTYTVDDGRGGTAVATVTVEVRPVTAVVNRAPAFTDAAANTVQDIAPGGSLAPLAAADPDGNPLVFSLVADGALPPGVTLRPDGTFAGTPTAPGTYRFVVRACDAAVPPGCDETTVTVVVAASALPADGGPRVPAGPDPRARLPRTGGATTGLAVAGVLLVVGTVARRLGRRGALAR